MRLRVIRNHRNAPGGSEMPRQDRTRRSLFAAAVAGALSLALPAAADEPVFSLRIKDHKFEPSEIEIPAATRVRINVRNEDSTAEEFESHSLNREKMVRPGGQATIFVGPLSPGRYEFFGEKNPTTARGAIIVR
jgi:heme/copper-type cytochrome/quinol oxidase subunit 2